MIKILCYQLHHRLIGIISLLMPFDLFAQDTLNFKKDPIVHFHWFPYLFLLCLLLIVLFFLAKKANPKLKNNSQCQLIEKVPLSTRLHIYIIDYEGQRYLIADNQNTIKLHALPEGKPV